MKYNFYFLSTIFFLGFLDNLYAGDSDYAIVNADQLNCRKRSNISSPAVKQYSFSTLIRIDKSHVVNDGKFIWVESLNDRCWVAKDYLLDTNAKESTILKYKIEYFHCFPPTEYSKGLSFYQIGDYVIHLAPRFSDADGMSEELVITLAKAVSLEKSLELFPKESRVCSEKKPFLTTTEYFGDMTMDLKKISLVILEDPIGIYWSYSASEINRETAGEMCEKFDKTKNEQFEVYQDYFIPEKTTINEINKEIENKKRIYMEPF